jgi:hypothetical protein
LVFGALAGRCCPCVCLRNLLERGEEWVEFGVEFFFANGTTRPNPDGAYAVGPGVHHFHYLERLVMKLVTSGIEWGGDVIEGVLLVGIAVTLWLVGYRFPHWLTVLAVGVIAIPALLVDAALAQDSGGQHDTSIAFALVFWPLPVLVVAFGAIAHLRRRGRSVSANRER